MTSDVIVPRRSRGRAAARLAGVVALALAGVVAVSGVAHAATPPFEPGTAIGTLTFFDANGNVVTGGTITDVPFAAYVEATAAGRVGDTKATLNDCLPKNGVAPGAWSCVQLGAASIYPDAGAPGSLATATLPLYHGSGGDTTLAQVQTEFPNTDTSTDGFAGLYQLRLVTSGPGQAGNASIYDTADVMITGTAWAQVYPAAGSTPPTTTTTTPSSGSSTTSTTTSSTTSTTTPGSSTTTSSTTSTTVSTGTATTVGLAVSPTDPVAAGATVTLTATLTPTDATGTVQFLDGGAALGGPVTVASGSAVTTTTSLAAGDHTISVQFTDPTSTFADSVSPNIDYTVSTAGTTVTGTTVTTVVVAVSTSSGSGLALTGSNVRGPLGVAILLVLVGSLFVVAETIRRRRLPGGRQRQEPPWQS